MLTTTLWEKKIILMEQINHIFLFKGPRLTTATIITENDIIEEWKEPKIWIKIFHIKIPF